MHLETAAASTELPRWVKFLLAFDVDYRKRRLHFMIEGQNQLYQVFDKPDFQGLRRAAIDRLKRSFYDSLDALNRLEDVANFKASTRRIWPRACSRLRRRLQMPKTLKNMRANSSYATAKTSTSWWIAWQRSSISIEHQRHRHVAGLDRSRAMALRCAARGVRQLPRIFILGRSDIAAHDLGRSRRI